MGGRRNTMVWAAFIIANVCLFVSKNGKPIATFSEWTVFIIPVIGLLVAGIVTEEKFDKNKAVELAKISGATDVAKAAGVAEVNKIEAEKK
ncbi:MAG: hypothetical protein WC491_07925 [Candidatus Omnitrophota bacterium]